MDYKQPERFALNRIVKGKMGAMILVAVAINCISVITLCAENTSPAAASPAKTNFETNKPVDWGALFKMHWQSRVAEFKEQNLAFDNVVLLGDSITEGFEVRKYFPGRRIVNRGIGADVIGNAMAPDDPRGVLQRLDNSLFDCAPSSVFILIGINDLNSGHTVDQMTAGYRELLQRIRAKRPDLNVYVQSVLPTRGAYAGKNPTVVEFNRRLKPMAAEFKCKFLDLHPLLCDPKGELKEQYTADGLHLTEPAYQVWREQILKALNWQ